MLESVDFKDKPLSIHTNELMTELSKKMPKLTFDYETEGYRTGRQHGTGIYRKLNVYDGRMLIGEIGDSGEGDIKYYVASPNVKTGRYHYQISMSDAKMKQSIHLKEVIKVAVTALTPLTFSQAMESSYNSFRRNMQNFTWEKERQIKQNTFDSEKLLNESDFLILEGVGSGQSAFRNYIDFLIWIDINPADGLTKVISRDGTKNSKQMRQFLLDQERHFALENTQNASDWQITSVP